MQLSQNFEDEIYCSTKPIYLSLRYAADTFGWIFLFRRLFHERLNPKRAFLLISFSQKRNVYLYVVSETFLGLRDHYSRPNSWDLRSKLIFARNLSSRCPKGTFLARTVFFHRLKHETGKLPELLRLLSS